MKTSKPKQPKPPTPTRQPDQPPPISDPDHRVRRAFRLPPDISIRLDQEIQRRKEAALDAGHLKEISDSDVLTDILAKALPARVKF